MTTPIPRESISAGLRRLADLVDAGLLDERKHPTILLDVPVVLADPSAVTRFAQVLGVDTHSAITDSGLHVSASADLDGVTVSGFAIVPPAPVSTLASYREQAAS